MSTQGDYPAAEDPARRWRLDDQSPKPSTEIPPLPRTSGRRIVLAIVGVFLTLWLGLFLTFREWKAHYLARVEFGASQVAPVVDQLASNPPPGIAPADWRAAVADTHAMLLALTSTGVLDESRMDDLRQDLATKVARARPETALETLSGIWDDLENEAGPLIAPDMSPPPAGSRHAARHSRPARPKLLGPSLNSSPDSPAKDDPPGASAGRAVAPRMTS